MATNELQEVLEGESAHTPPANILEALDAESAHRTLPGAPHSIYEELWHIVYWQQITLDWVAGVETPLPEHASGGFPNASQIAAESWNQLCERFLSTCREAVAAAGDAGRLDQPIHCPSRPGVPVRRMTVREQLESLGAHNAYHFGRIVLMRQLMGLWPPPSGGFTW